MACLNDIKFLQEFLVLGAPCFTTNSVICKVNLYCLDVLLFWHLHSRLNIPIFNFFFFFVACCIEPIEEYIWFR